MKKKKHNLTAIKQLYLVENDFIYLQKQVINDLTL